MVPKRATIALTVVIIGLLLAFVNGFLLLELIIGTPEDKSRLEVAVTTGCALSVICIVVGNYFLQRYKHESHRKSGS